MIGRYTRFVAFLQPILSIWFFAGMPLSMLLSSLYTYFGIAQPPLLFFLSSGTYFSGSLLGGFWSIGRLRMPKKAPVELLAYLCVLLGSLGFLCLGVVFAVVGCRRL